MSRSHNDNLQMSKIQHKNVRFIKDFWIACKSHYNSYPRLVILSKLVLYKHILDKSTFMLINSFNYYSSSHPKVYHIK